MYCNMLSAIASLMISVCPLLSITSSRPWVVWFSAKLVFSQLKAPLPESAFRKLHDVAFMHQGDRPALVIQGILDGVANQPFTPLFRDGLDAERTLFGKPYSGNPPFPVAETP